MIYKNREVCKDTYYVGASDRRLALFENIYPLTNGASYNSYIILDEKTCVLDGVDHSVRDIYIDKVKAALNGRKLDYLVIQHMEPDHACCLKDLIALMYATRARLNVKTSTLGESFKFAFLSASINAIVVFPLPAVPNTTVCPFASKANTSSCAPLGCISIDYPY